MRSEPLHKAIADVILKPMDVGRLIDAILDAPNTDAKVVAILAAMEDISVGQLIGNIFEAFRTSQRDFAQQLNISQSALSRFLSEDRKVSISTVHEIANSFKLDPTVAAYMITMAAQSETKNYILAQIKDMVADPMSANLPTLEMLSLDMLDTLQKAQKRACLTLHEQESDS